MADTPKIGPRPGGLIDRRMQAMEQAAGAVPPPPAVVVTPAPAPVQPAAALSPEEIALRRKYGMPIPGEQKPTALQKLKALMGFAPPPTPAAPPVPPVVVPATPPQ